ncbi:helix-turn-helix transcriptional regulator [Bifidobacterium breve]|uniref:helix-turn-helix transcriptional regulator n=1 Tax=Bifidobacterium breve TaxID=1685 RepID=UPI003D082141
MNQLTVAVHSIRQLSTALRDARRNAGITQTELAETTGISRPWINQLEQGRIDNPGLERVFIICDALNVRLTISYDIQTTQASHNDAADPTVITGTIDNSQDSERPIVPPSPYRNPSGNISAITKALDSASPLKEQVSGAIQQSMRSMDWTILSHSALSSLSSLKQSSDHIAQQSALLNGISPTDTANRNLGSDTNSNGNQAADGNTEGAV